MWNRRPFSTFLQDCDNQIFPEVSYQEIEELDISEFRVEADLLAKYCQ